MLLTYVLIFVFFVFLSIIVLYIVYTFVLPKKMEDILKMIESGQTKLAIKKLNELLEKDDRNVYAHYLLAEAYFREENFQYSIVEYRQVLKFARFDDRMKESEIRSRLAKLYINREMVEDAKKEYLILTKIDPDNFENYFELGKIYFNAGTLDKAIPFFKKTISCNANHEQSYYFLGQIHYRSNAFVDARQMFINAIKLDPTNYKSHYFLGLVLRQQNDYDWAIKEFEISQKSEDLRVKSFLAKGSCYMEKGQLPKAVMEFQRGLKFARRGSETELNLRYFLADSQEKMRDIHSAISNWEKIVEVNANFRDVQEKLKNYSEFRQDDRIKDFLIAGLAQFEHVCRKLVEAMGHNIMDVEIVNDTDIEIIGTETEGKWRNTRQTNRIIRIIRTTDTIQDRLLRRLYESMKLKNATRIIVITTGDFSQSAVDFANTRPIELMGKAQLVELLRKI
ncbi:MAG TPA: tetratricopeptide repeat protein [Spirochaetota bacterium]|nr:tetratricopeptide repeat protein [Spirochaetota bacterium]HSA13462.1 tetratricopeptide repeat protein [Spirochaetota bacterium]